MGHGPNPKTSVVVHIRDILASFLDDKGDVAWRRLSGPPEEREFIHVDCRRCASLALLVIWNPRSLKAAPGASGSLQPLQSRKLQPVYGDVKLEDSRRQATQFDAGSERSWTERRAGSTHHWTI
ncbi:unnamed protein product [Pleuronectes platessa]|uniref:Uncharacterized protein n=1 Tax=Pleuronectes platessa TaxID=8262 RepID=A0A9N7U533_PLEPL|nr:unnamed protein product [Pleuronectes platessa]